MSIQVLFFAVGAGLLLVPLVANVYDVYPTLPMVFFGGLFLAVAIVIEVYQRFYKIAQSNEAIVRTGGLVGSVSRGPQVAVGTGLWSVPLIHSHVRVGFRQWVFSVTKKDSEALLCNDCLLANISATFKVSVPQTREAVLKFLAAAGNRPLDSEDTIMKLCLDTLETSLRDACTSKPYEKIFEGREEVANEIENSVADDFSKSGLQLDSAKLTEVDPTPLEFYDPTNPQHARGMTAIVQITEDQRLAKEAKTLRTNEAVRQIEVQTRKQIHELDKDEQLAASGHEKEISIRRANDAAAAKENEISLEEAVERRRLALERTLELEKIENERELEIANLTKSRTTDEQELENRVALEIVEGTKRIEALKKAVELATAEEETSRHQAAAERAKHQIETAVAVEHAEREKSIAVIEHQAQAEKQRINENMRADTAAYAVRQEADARKQAAESNYLAGLWAAQTELEVAEQRSAARKLEETVELETLRERLAIIQDELRARESNKAAAQLDLERLRIEKEAEARLALAQALGQLAGHAKMNFVGSPEMLTALIEGMAKSMGFSAVTPKSGDVVPLTSADNQERPDTDGHPEVAAFLAECMKDGDVDTQGMENMIRIMSSLTGHNSGR